MSENTYPFVEKIYNKGYNILDLFYTYHITDNLDFNISALNVNNDRHKDLVGGAVMGRQVVMRFTSSF